MIIYATIVLGFLVVIHEGGHYLTARAFGVRVSEFMIGLPGPSIGFTHGETRFGLTAVPLGGYARVCGMESGPMSPHLQSALTSLYARGTTTVEQVAADCGITHDEADEALFELLEWGSAVGAHRKEPDNIYRTPAVNPTKKQVKQAIEKGETVPVAMAEGSARPLENPSEFFKSEYSRQYRALPFWKRSVIVLSGVIINLLFAIIAFVIIYSVMGIDVQNTTTGEITHVALDPLRALQVGFVYIGMVIQAVIGLFNPQTAAETVANSTSIMGIAVLSKSAAEAGFQSFLAFTAMISVSLGIMNMLPIPPLDGGRFIIEIYQRVRSKLMSERAINAMTAIGMAFVLTLFVVMMNQDIQRFIFNNW